MNAIQDIKLKAEAAFSALSSREQKLLLISSAVLCFLVLAMTVWLTESSLTDKRKSITHKKKSLAEITSLESQYDEAQKRKRDEERRLSSNSVSLMSKLQDAATSLNLKLKDVNPREVPLKGSEIIEVSVEANLKSLSLDKLNDFLEKIEGRSQKGLVKITRLKVNTRHDDATLLDVKMTVVTWKKEG